MNRNTVLIAAAAAVLAGAGGWYAWQRNRVEVVPEPEVPAAAESAPLEEAPVIEHPLTEPAAEEASAAAPLPSLADSDLPLITALTEVAGADGVAAWLVPEGVVRRFVATVDNLPRSAVAEKTRPLRAVPGAFVVERSMTDASSGEERIAISPENAGRYDAGVAALQAMDMRQVAALYRRFYPLFQQSYEDLGYPGRYFNDRVVGVIDHLLQTPVPDTPPLLVQPKAMYEYADASLEARSAGQKLLIRMGPEHAAAVKAQLTALRAEISSTKE
jgi:hypothetical protein